MVWRQLLRQAPERVLEELVCLKLFKCFLVSTLSWPRFDQVCLSSFKISAKVDVAHKLIGRLLKHNFERFDR